MKTGICNELFEGWELARVAEFAKGVGYDGLEIAPFTLAPDPRDLTETDALKAGQVVREAGMAVIGLHWLLAAPDGMHVTTDDASVRDETVEFLCHLARICAAMGGTVMVFGSPKQRAVAPGQSHETAFGRIADACRAVAEVAGPLGVMLAVEPLGPAEDNLLDSTERGVRLVERVDHPACRLHLDVKAMCAQGEEPAAMIRAHATILGHFHANDANRRGPGMGDTDFAPIMAALRDVGYGGYVSVEAFESEPGPETVARLSLECLNRA